MCLRLAELCGDLPAYYQIDWIRIWQLPGNKRVGCNPSDYPTEGWIESHREDYIFPYYDEPLRPVFAGGRDCTDTSECGGESR